MAADASIRREAPYFDVNEDLKELESALGGGNATEEVDPVKKVILLNLKNTIIFWGNDSRWTFFTCGDRSSNGPCCCRWWWGFFCTPTRRPFS